MAMYFPFKTAFAVPHRFWTIVFSFPHFQGRHVSVLSVSNTASRPRVLLELLVSVCSLAGAVRESACSPVQVATASQRLNVAAPSPFHLSSDICARFHGSPLRTSILSTGDVHL